MLSRMPSKLGAMKPVAGIMPSRPSSQSPDPLVGSPATGSPTRGRADASHGCPAHPFLGQATQAHLDLSPLEHTVRPLIPSMRARHSFSDTGLDQACRFPVEVDVELLLELY